MSEQQKAIVQVQSEKSLWIKLKEIKIGVVSLPVYIAFSVIVFIAMYAEAIPVDMMGGLGIIIAFGWLLGTIGNTIPGLNKFGGSTILAMLVPATLVLFNLIPQNSLDAVNMLMSEANFLDLYVFALVSGSILGMNRNILVKGFARMVLPMMAGFILALIIPSTIGWALGLGFTDTLFYIVTPAMAGGMGGGVLPLGLGYSAITGADYGELIAILAPASILSNFFAIVGAAVFNRIGEKKSHLTGNGTLIKSDESINLSEDNEKLELPVSYGLLGTGLYLLVTLYIAGTFFEGIIGLPAAVIIIFTVTVLKYFQVLPSRVEAGAKQFNSLISTNFTLPLMVGLGIIYLTLEDVIAMLSWQYLIVLLSVVITLGLTGYFISRFVNMYPVDSAIISLNQAAMGGTGNVAVLSTSNRQELMPFAQVATRIGGAITISLMITAMRLLG
ncbi:2-hydroxycarboxylate transporter family protein [Aerococcaceae bacterium DSM 111022]|nr:2-hydroxycarboxylate transporter family protein [Aerococcaceae bacterium DSM 111022]